MAAHQALLSLGFSRQEHWSGLPFPSPGDLPDPGTESRSPTLEADALTSEVTGISPSNFDSTAFHMMYSACKLNKWVIFFNPLI